MGLDSIEKFPERSKGRRISIASYNKMIADYLVGKRANYKKKQEQLGAAATTTKNDQE